jgi:hypothetical protein
VAVFARWHNADLEVHARPVPRYLWTTVSIDVLLDGEPILCTGGQASLLGRCRSRFRHEGEAHKAELSWGKMANGAFPFMLRIDEELVLASEVPVDNWRIVLAGWIAAVVVVLLAIVAACIGFGIFLF